MTPVVETIATDCWLLAPAQSCQMLCIDTNQIPHVAYIDGAHRKVYHAYRDADGWHTQSIYTAEEEIYAVSISLDALSNPSILFIFTNMYPGPYKNDICMRWNGTTWDTTEIPFMTGSRPLTHIYDNNNYFHTMFYWHSGGGASHQTRHLYFDGTTWIHETVPLPAGMAESNGGFVALSNADDLCFVYSTQEGDFKPNSLTTSKKSWGAWTSTEAIKTYTDTCVVEQFDYYFMPQRMSLAIDGSNSKHIIASLASAGGCGPHCIEYFNNTGGIWQSEIVDPDTILASSECISRVVVDSHNQPHFVYRTSGNEIRYAHKKNGTWNIQTIADSGSIPSIAISGDDIVHITYGSGGLKYINLGETPPIDHDVSFVVPGGATLHIDETLIGTTSVSRLLASLKKWRI